MSSEPPPKLEPGLEGSCERVVTQELTLAHINPDWPAVFSTPAMIGLMELASSLATLKALPSGALQVGVRIEVDHVKPLPVGAVVTAISKLVEIDGRRLVFEAEVRSGGQVIGHGRIFHFIVDHSRFKAIAGQKPPTL
jgi:predicted thioesterase